MNTLCVCRVSTWRAIMIIRTIVATCMRRVCAMLVPHYLCKFAAALIECHLLMSNKEPRFAMRGFVQLH